MNKTKAIISSNPILTKGDWILFNPWVLNSEFYFPERKEISGKAQQHKNTLVDLKWNMKGLLTCQKNKINSGEGVQWWCTQTLILTLCYGTMGSEVELRWL